MISKLMSRKKSYERMMNANQAPPGRSNLVAHQELSAKRSQEVLLSQNRAQQLSRANDPSNAAKKQLQYYESTPQNPGSRKHTSSMRGKNNAASTPAILDITGKNVVKNNGPYKAPANIIPKDGGIDLGERVE